MGPHSHIPHAAGESPVASSSQAPYRRNYSAHGAPAVCTSCNLSEIIWHSQAPVPPAGRCTLLVHRHHEDRGAAAQSFRRSSGVSSKPTLMRHSSAPSRASSASLKRRPPCVPQLHVYDALLEQVGVVLLARRCSAAGPHPLHPARRPPAAGALSLQTISRGRLPPLVDLLTTAHHVKSQSLCRQMASCHLPRPAHVLLAHQACELRWAVGCSWSAPLDGRQRAGRHGDAAPRLLQRCSVRMLPQK
jgi:hypothetical protein